MPEVTIKVRDNGPLLVDGPVTIVDAEELGGAMTEKLAELFDEQIEPEPRRMPRRRLHS